MALDRCAPPKPMKGAALLASRERRAVHVRDEQREMQAAKRRDGHKCRWPSCAYAKRDLPIDACHLVHRGMGGDPKRTRTTRDQIWAACRIHHGLYDRGEIDVQPLTSAGTDGPLAFYRRAGSGRLEHVATEVRIGVSVTRERS